MKNIKLLIGATILLCVVCAVIYFVSDKTPDSSLSKNKQVAVIMETGGCLMCHTKDAQLPFYANMPIAKTQIQNDIQLGIKHIDLSDLYDALVNDKKINEADMARVESSILNKRMPMAKYTAMHWGAGINSSEMNMVSQWAKDIRKNHLCKGLSCEEFANEPVRPIGVFETNPEKVALGDKLYHDTRLSSDGTVSCASCHGLHTGGVDNLQFSEGIAKQVGGVNAPTVFNSAYNFVQFWDGRAEDLAAQAAGPPLNPIEMGHKSFNDIVAVLQSDKDFLKEFSKIYADGFSEANITNAIAEFEKTLTTPDSKFDKYLKGDKTAINADEIEGYELFKANKCATCHVGENLGGQSYELMGQRADYFVDRATEITEEDLGRYKQVKEIYYKHRFKVPGLRNIALTYPYYHDGTVKNLDEAVVKMSEYQNGITLSDDDVSKIVKFLETLTGEYNGTLLSNANTK